MAARTSPGLTARVRAVLVSAPFLVCLAALLLNDRWLKHAFSGVVTGKVSDFAGIAVVGLLMAAALPRHRLVGAIGVSVVFAWWKSPLSEAAIDWLSRLSPFLFSRSVDYGDLVALAILPLCGPAADLAFKRAPDLGAFRRAASVPLALAAAVAIMGTSMVMAHRNYALRDPDARIDAARVSRVIDEVAARHGMRWLSPSSKDNVAHYEGGGLWLEYRLDEIHGIRLNITATQDGFFFGTSGEKRADALREDINNALAAQVPGLEYVEPLKVKPPPRAPCAPSPAPTPPCRS